MSRRPPIGRRDENEAEIVEALRAVGATVDQLPGDGLPDLLVGRHGHTYLLEVKAPDAYTRMRKDEVAAGGEFEGLATTLTRKQAKWWKGWNGKPPIIVTSPHDALVAIGAPCPCDRCTAGDQAVREADEVLGGGMPTTREAQTALANHLLEEMRTAYRRGTIAAEMGKEPDECPYDASYQRDAWQWGYIRVIWVARALEAEAQIGGEWEPTPPDAPWVLVWQRDDAQVNVLAREWSARWRRMGTSKTWTRAELARMHRRAGWWYRAVAIDLPDAPPPAAKPIASQTAFGALVRDARVAADKSIRDVAKALGISSVRLGEIERGKREPLAIGEWERLRQVLPGLSQVEVWAAFEQYYAWADELDDAVRQDAALPPRK